MKVLVVEDDPSLRAFLKEGLSREGFAIDLARDGKEGLAAARGDSYDVILLDVMMPEMDGYTVLRTLRSERIDVPVIMVTSQGQERDKLAGFDGGADDYVVKPFL